MSTLREPARSWPRAVAIVIAALVLAACGSSNPLGGGEISGDLKSIKVGSADFTESKIIAEIYAQALEANGFTVTRQFGIGSRETYIPAVQDHSIDLIPEYTGNLLQYFDKETTATTPDAVLLGAAQGAPRRPVDPLPVARRGQGHPRGHRGDRAAVEPQDDRGSRHAFRAR